MSRTQDRSKLDDALDPKTFITRLDDEEHDLSRCSFTYKGRSVPGSKLAELLGIADDAATHRLPANL